MSARDEHCLSGHSVTEKQRREDCAPFEEELGTLEQPAGGAPGVQNLGHSADQLSASACGAVAEQDSEAKLAQHGRFL